MTWSNKLCQCQHKMLKNSDQLIETIKFYASIQVQKMVIPNSALPHNLTGLLVSYFKNVNLVLRHVRNKSAVYWLCLALYINSEFHPVIPLQVEFVFSGLFRKKSEKTSRLLIWRTVYKVQHWKWRFWQLTHCSASAALWNVAFCIFWWWDSSNSMLSHTATLKIQLQFYNWIWYYKE